MAEMISYCGLVCTECPAFLATQGGDEGALAEVAAEWTREFGVEIPPESILCDGCTSDTGRICGYCGACPVRACGVRRGVATCADCSDYGCDKLRACPAYKARGKEVLERLRSGEA